MALPEFEAMESAYRVLQQLDPAARRRAVHWLVDALDTPAVLPEIPSDLTTVEQPAAADTAEASRGTKAPAARTARGRGRRDNDVAGEQRPTRRGRRKEATAEPATPQDGAGHERAYRRMPPVDEVLAAYEQVGTVSRLAEYFGVPRHTAQGWARRLRSQGYSIGQSA